MRRAFLASGLLLAVVTFAADDVRRTYQFGDIAFGEILESEIEYGCGCSFHHPPSSKATVNPLIQWAFGAPAKIHVDGRLEALEADGNCFGESELGKPEACRLRAPSLSADIAAKASGVCPEDSESCAATEYTGVLTVSKGGKRARIPVWGARGC